MWRNLESREAEDYWGIGSGSAHPPRRWSEEKLEEELGSAVSSPNLGWPLASILACALLLSPTFLFPSSLLPSHLLFIYSPLLGQKIPIPLVPYFLESPTSSAGKHQKAWKQAKEQTSVGTQMSLLRSVPPGKNLQLAQILPCSPLFLLDMPRPELTFNITILIPGLVGVCGVGGWGIINETSFVMSSWNYWSRVMRTWVFTILASLFLIMFEIFHYKKDKNKNLRSLLFLLLFCLSLPLVMMLCFKKKNNSGLIWFRFYFLLHNSLPLFYSLGCYNEPNVLIHKNHDSVHQNSLHPQKLGCALYDIPIHSLPIPPSWFW